MHPLDEFLLEILPKGWRISQMYVQLEDPNPDPDNLDGAFRPASVNLSHVSGGMFVSGEGPTVGAALDDAKHKIEIVRQ